MMASTSLALPSMHAAPNLVAIKVTDPTLSATDISLMKVIASSRKAGNRILPVKPRAAPEGATRRGSEASQTEELQPRRPGLAASSSLPALVSEAAANWQAEVKAEAEARRRLISLRREAGRYKREKAARLIATGRLASATAVRNDLDELGGTKLQRSFAVAPADEDAVGRLATILLRALEYIEPDENARSWFKLYRFCDRDGNGRFEYIELLWVIRNTLKLSREELSDEVRAALEQNGTLYERVRVGNPWAHKRAHTSHRVRYPPVVYRSS